MAKLTLKNCEIGDNQPIFIIAEAGVNHNGDIKVAHQLIDAAVDVGANAVKFQTFITEEIVSLHAPLAGHHIANTGKKMSHFDLIKKLELPFECFVELKAHCEEKNLIFISTPYDLPSAQFLIDLKCEVIKNASSEMTNYPLLHVIGNSKIPVILSTGMSTWEEIIDSIEFLSNYHSNIGILKCTSNYPASPGSIHLRGICKLQEHFPQQVIGFSDHSEGDEVSLTAVGLGVPLLEKHFTLDKNAWGPDHNASMVPKEFGRFVSSIRKAEVALGKKDWGIQKEEKSQEINMRKGVYARRNISLGEQIGLQDVKFLRPYGKVTPKEFFLTYKNKVATTDIQAETELLPKFFQI